MTSVLLQLAVALYLLLPNAVWAQAIVTPVKDPFAYSLRQYGLILAISLLGGVVGWWRKVQRGVLPLGGPAAFVGELTTSAFAGLLAFWLCEAFGVSMLVTACVAGLAGHAGGAGVQWLETAVRKKAERVMGISSTGPAPLRKD